MNEIFLINAKMLIKEIYLNIGKNKSFNIIGIAILVLRK